MPLVAFVLGTRVRPRPPRAAGNEPVPVVHADEDPRPPRWIAAPSRRNWIATAIAAVPAVVIIAILDRDSDAPTEQWLLPLVMIVWATYSIVHSVLTVCGLWGIEGGRLHRSVEVRRRRRWGFGLTSSALSIAVQTPIVVLVIVAAIVVTPAFRGDRYLVALVLAFVVITWINTALLFTENYISRGRGGLAFPGRGRIGFADYLYFSLAVQMTFGTSDVAITDRSTRRNVTVHAATAFAFNTVIIAMIVSLLVSG